MEERSSIFSARGDRVRIGYTEGIALAGVELIDENGGGPGVRCECANGEKVNELAGLTGQRANDEKVNELAELDSIFDFSTDFMVNR